MFERRTRQAFPVRNIILLAVAAGALLLFMLRKTERMPAQEIRVVNPEQEEKRDSGLFPFEEYYAVRQYPDYEPAVSAYEAAMYEARLSAAAARPRGGLEGITASWTVQGPGNIGARINTIAVDPSDKNTIYIGYSGGGAWKTTDGGVTWKPVFDQNGFLAIGHIYVDPLNPSHVYIGTGDPNISAYPFIGNGVWKSTDKGESWSLLGLTNQRIVSKIIANPGGSQKLYAATMGIPFERNNQRGLYQSANDGADWQQSLFVSNQTGIIDMAVSPANPGVIYAASWDRIRSNRESLVFGENARIWKTTNGGQTWTPLSGGLPNGPQCRIGLAIDPSNDQHILASYCGTNLDFLGLYESFNGGQTWQFNPCNGLDFGFQGGFAWYFGKVRINPYNPSDIWLLGVTSYRSLDGGQNWYQAAGWAQDIHADHHDLVFLSENDMLLGTDGGLYRSTDGGSNWFRAENIPTTQFYRVAHNPHVPDWYYGGAQDNGTLGGNASQINSWNRLFGGDGFQAVFHPTNPNIYYFEYQNGAINGTTDGNFFDGATQGIEGSDRRHWDMQYIMSRHNPDIMYTGTYRLYKGYGHLPNWSPITEDLTDGNIYGARFHTISTLDESPIDPNQVIVGTTDGNVWVVNPDAGTRTNVSAGLPDRYVSSVKASTSDPNRIFITQTGYRDNDFTPHIFRSDNLGATWTPIGGNLPPLAINDMHILPGHQDSVIFAATDGGVYITQNGGQQWERLGSGMPFVPVYDLDMNLSRRTLIAGTHARSIMTYPLDSLRIGENSSTFSPGGIAPPSLSVNPSPATGNTTLTLSNLLSKQEAAVYIADMSGDVVWRELFSGYGDHRRNIDVSQLAPGIYVACARINGKALIVRKFVVTR